MTADACAQPSRFANAQLHDARFPLLELEHILARLLSIVRYSSAFCHGFDSQGRSQRDG